MVEKATGIHNLHQQTDGAVDRRSDEGTTYAYEAL